MTSNTIGIPTSFVTRRRPPSAFRVRRFGFDWLGYGWARAAIRAASAIALAIDAGNSRKIIAQKLASGLMLEQIISVSALAGFSEHHTGRAIDIGTPGCPPVTEEFGKTPAFGGLTRRGQDFGFRLTGVRHRSKWLGGIEGFGLVVAAALYLVGGIRYYHDDILGVRAPSPLKESDETRSLCVSAPPHANEASRIQSLV